MYVAVFDADLVVLCKSLHDCALAPQYLSWSLNVYMYECTAYVGVQNYLPFRL